MRAVPGAGMCCWVSSRLLLAVVSPLVFLRAAMLGMCKCCRSECLWMLFRTTFAPVFCVRVARVLHDVNESYRAEK